MILKCFTKNTHSMQKKALKEDRKDMRHTGTKSKTRDTNPISQ